MAIYSRNTNIHSSNPLPEHIPKNSNLKLSLLSKNTNLNPRLSCYSFSKNILCWSSKNLLQNPPQSILKNIEFKTQFVGENCRIKHKLVSDSSQKISFPNKYSQIVPEKYAKKPLLRSLWSSRKYP